MKFDGEASYAKPTEETSLGRQEPVVGQEYNELDELVRLGEAYKVDTTDKMPGATEPDISIDAHEELVSVQPLQTEIATLEAEGSVVDTTETVPVSQAEATEIGLPDFKHEQSQAGVTFSAKELRDRYDGAYRSNVAVEAWEKRGRQRENRDEGREKYGAEAEADEIERVREGIKSAQSYSLGSLERQLVDMKRQTESSLDSLNTLTRLKRQEMAMRGTFSKLIALGQKYTSLLGIDAYQAKIDDFDSQRRELLAQEAQKNEDLQSQIDKIKLEIQNQQQLQEGKVRTNYSSQRERIEGEFISGRKSLLSSVREKNQGSRLASERTAELLTEGKLNVSELARETNSLVVHTLPLEGWSMNNTSMNNTEIDVEKIGVADKIKIVTEKKPDLSVSIVAIDNPQVSQGTMYPFGLVVDGALIASYDGDSSTIAKGDKRYRKYVGGSEGETLQTEPQEAFKKNAQELPGFGRYNEAIVYSPNVKGIFIDSERLKPVLDTQTGRPHDYYKDTIQDYYLPGQEAQVLEQYKGFIDELDKMSIEDDMPRKRVIAERGPYAGQEVYKFKRMRSGEQKAVEFAQTNYPDLPIYIRRADGVYDMSGQKVSAEDVYTEKA